MKEYTVTLEQIDNMKHCIGYEVQRVKGRKYKKYEAFRNYYTTVDNHPGWDKLCEQGLAIKRDFKMGGGDNPQIYFVTEEGIKFLSEITGVKITENGVK